MDLSYILNRIFFTFFIVWGVAWLGIFAMGLLAGADGIRIGIFGVTFFFTIAASLTYLVHYSKKTPNIKQIIVRSIIQLLLVIGIAFAITTYADVFHQAVVITRTMFAVTVVIGYIIVALHEWYTFMKFKNLADKINLRLKDKFGK